MRACTLAALMTRVRIAAALTLALSAPLVLFGCSKKTLDLTTKAKLIRVFVNRTDPKTGAPLSADVEMLFDGCGGGEYRKVIRGGAEFAQCVKGLTSGEVFDVQMQQGRRRDGRLRSRVTGFGPCTRVPDPTDTRSYDEFRTCSELKTDGILVGFRCDYKPTKAELAACPFLAQR